MRTERLDARAVRAELLDRLQYFRLEPRVVLDLGGSADHDARELKRRYGRALVVVVDSAGTGLPGARPWRPLPRRARFFRRFERICAEARRLPLRAGSIDLVFSSLLLRSPEEVPAVLSEIRRVLRPGGLLLLSAGGTAAPGLDVQDLGDALAHMGFAQPVLDVDRYGAVEIIFAAAWAGTAQGATVVDGEARVPVTSIGRRERDGDGS